MPREKSIRTKQDKKAKLLQDMTVQFTQFCEKKQVDFKEPFTGIIYFMRKIREFNSRHRRQIRELKKEIKECEAEIIELDTEAEELTTLMAQLDDAIREQAKEKTKKTEEPTRVQKRPNAKVKTEHEERNYEFGLPDGYDGAPAKVKEERVEEPRKKKSKK